MKSISLLTLALAFLSAFFMLLPTPEATTAKAITTEPLKQQQALSAKSPQEIMTEQNNKIKVISHFTDKNLTPQFGTRFTFTSDEMMQGNSNAKINWVAEGCDDAGALKVKATLGFKFAFPWSGAFYMLGQHMSHTEDLSNYAGIRFNVKGTPGQYRFMIFTPNTQRPAELNFAVSEKCQSIYLDFNKADSVDWRHISAFAWAGGAHSFVSTAASAQDQTLPFEFVLDNIQLETQ